MVCLNWSKLKAIDQEIYIFSFVALNVSKVEVYILHFIFSIALQVTVVANKSCLSYKQWVKY